MAPPKTDKKKAKRKAKLKQARTRKSLAIQRSQRRFLLDEAIWLREMGNYRDALIFIRQVLRQDPDNADALREMLIIGQATRNPSVEFNALEGLDRAGCLPAYVRPAYCGLQLQRQRFQDARRVAEEGLALLPHVRISGKRELRRFYTQLIATEEFVPRSEPEVKSHPVRPPRASRTSVGGAKAEPLKPAASFEPKAPVAVPPIPVVIEMDEAAFANVMQPRAVSLPEDYELTLQAHQIRLRETFDRLICLGTLKNVRSFPYQEETARKVLRRFRGRALLDAGLEVAPRRYLRSAPVPKELSDQLHKILGGLKKAAGGAVLRETAGFQERMNRKFRRDVSNLGEYYRSLETEMRQSLDCSGLSDQLVQDRRAKIALVPEELARKKDDLFKKYSIRIAIVPCAVLLVATPAVKVLMRVCIGRKQKAIPAFYNPVTKTMDPLVCEGCQGSATRIGFCDQAHLLCPDCNSRCLVCRNG